MNWIVCVSLLLGFANLATACSCGQKKSRIVGGSETDANEYPWQVYLKHNGSQYCGGSLITKDWIVTAAHCLDLETSHYTAILGEHSKLVDEATSEEIGISQKIIHSGYNDDTLDNDIGLLKLSKSATLSDAVSPVCLPFNAKDALDTLCEGTVLTVTGWGATSSGGDLSDVLMEVDVNYISTAVCKSDKYSYGDEITDNMICAGVAGGGKDSCQGDSGGPIVYYCSDNSVNYLMGVVSWGSGCAEADAPGVYTKLTNYLDWIKTETSAESDFCVI